MIKKTLICLFLIALYSGHAWVIDGYRKMTIKCKNKYTGEDIGDDPLDYVHCNMGWGGGDNGWYISGVFDTSVESLNDADDIYYIPRSAGDGNYKYSIGMITDITPK